MQSTAVLVLGSGDNKGLIELLFNMGLAPLVRGSIEGALERIRHERFAMVVVDRSGAEVDVLEFILNVRDINVELPIVVVGRSDDRLDDQILQAQFKTFLIGGLDTADQLARELDQVLDA